MGTEIIDYEPKRKEHVNIGMIANEMARHIRDEESHRHACQQLLEIKAKRNAWREFIDPLVKKTKQVYDEALSKRRELEEPLRQAEEDILKPAIAKWDDKQQEIKRVQEKEIKKTTGADVVLPNLPKVEGIQYRTNYRAHLIDKKLFIEAVYKGSIPPEAVLPNQSLLNSMAKNFKSGLNWPGVKIVEEKSVVAKPRVEA